MSRVTGLQKLACPHQELTPEDGEAYALCTRCGASVPLRLTAKMLDKAFEDATAGAER